MIRFEDWYVVLLGSTSEKRYQLNLKYFSGLTIHRLDTDRKLLIAVTTFTSYYLFFSLLLV